MSKDERSELEKRLTEVDVDAHETASLAIRLDRAAEVDGTVLFDDGSPASDVSLKIEAKPSKAASTMREKEHDSGWSYLSGYSPSTDDRGKFRIIGLQPGLYKVSAQLGTFSAEHEGDYYTLPVGANSGTFGHLAFFYGNAFRSKDARAVHVHEGETVVGIDITIPLTKLHRVSGTVLLQSTGSLLRQPWFGCRIETRWKKCAAPSWRMVCFRSPICRRAIMCSKRKLFIKTTVRATRRGRAGAMAQSSFPSPALHR